MALRLDQDIGRPLKINERFSDVFSTSIKTRLGISMVNLSLENSGGQESDVQITPLGMIIISAKIEVEFELQ